MLPLIGSIAFAFEASAVWAAKLAASTIAATAAFRVLVMTKSFHQLSIDGPHKPRRRRDAYYLITATAFGSWSAFGSVSTKL